MKDRITLGQGKQFPTQKFQHSEKDQVFLPWQDRTAENQNRAKTGAHSLYHWAIGVFPLQYVSKEAKGTKLWDIPRGQEQECGDPVLEYACLLSKSCKLQPDKQQDVVSLLRIGKK